MHSIDELFVKKGEKSVQMFLYLAGWREGGYERFTPLKIK